MKQYRAAVIGLTGIGAEPRVPAPAPTLGEVMPHSHVSAYAAIPRTTVVGVCDLVPALLEKFKTDWGEQFPEAKTYTDYREMLKNERVDILSVATSDHRHTQLVVDAAEAGVKGIFCEKPIATTLADADRMIEACRHAGVPMLIDHTRRWSPLFLETRRLVRSGAIGPVWRVVATTGGPRAMLFRNGTHLIDCVNIFVESDPDWAIAVLDDEHAGHAPRYTGDGGRDPKLDPGGSAIVRYQSGARVLLNFSKNTVPGLELEVVGDKGKVYVGANHAELWQRLDDGQLMHRTIFPPQTTRGGMVGAIHELIGLIENGGTGSSTPEDGRRVLSIMLAILQSNARGGAKVSFPIQDA